MNIAIIVAAGESRRFKGDIPKQYEKLGNKPVICYAIESFKLHNSIEKIILVVHPQHEKYYRDIAIKYKIEDLVIGGKTRTESVFNALKHLEKVNPNRILIHDAARPFVNERLINDALDCLSNNEASIPVVAVEDTLKKINDKTNLTIDRSDLYRIQTPQGFNFKTLLKAHQELQGEIYTDDASILEKLNYKIATFKGSQLNFKITEADDLIRAKKMIVENKTIRIGQGFDVHKYSQETLDGSICLGGVKIKHNKHIIAHSDGDVLLHSLVDAILGSIAAGDIGEHFPPSNSDFKDMNSEIFIAKALKLLKEKNGRIINVDITIICEKPKITPERTKIRENLARLLESDINNVSVKATTTEKLGFTGREEGIAVQTSILVETSL